MLFTQPIDDSSRVNIILLMFKLRNLLIEGNMYLIWSKGVQMYLMLI